jgi:hypothetical protein
LKFLDLGIIGITQQDECLDRFLTIAPELSNICNQFIKTFSIDDPEWTTDEHHEITGSMASRMQTYKRKLVDLFVEYDIFDCCDGTYLSNMFSREIINEEIAEDIINRDKIGENLYQTFKKDRLIEGNKTVWDHLARSKIATFTTHITKLNLKTKSTKIDHRLIQIVAVVSLSRPELNLRRTVQNYELSEIPWSLFSGKGILLLAQDKAKILHALEKFQHSTIENNVAPKAIIIDGMALVHAMKKGPGIKNCLDLSELFIQYLVRKTEGYEVIYLVFDRYIKNSLKNQTRDKRRNSQTRYTIADKTVIQKIPLHDLLSNIETKQELTIYLAAKTLIYSKSSDKLKKFFVTADTTSDNNQGHPIIVHSHEEADTIIVLHAASIPPNYSLYVDSPDTDVALLLISFFKELPSSCTFLTGKNDSRRKIDIKQIYDNLGPDRVSAILGFHALTGCDTTGKFAGRSKETAFKLFLNANESILKALASLGSDNFNIDIEYNFLEQFVCLLYKSEKTLPETRWHYFSKKQAQDEHLPPTRGALLQHILRAHFITHIWKTSTIHNPLQWDPTKYGWEMVSDKLQPIMTKDPSAPDAILELVKCNCKKGCLTNACSCKGNNLPCTEICGCSSYCCMNIYRVEVND